MSELVKWFEKRREAKVITMMQRHLATTISAVEDLERSVKAAADNNEKKMNEGIIRVTSAEKEADKLRRDVMVELANSGMTMLVEFHHISVIFGKWRMVE